MTNSNKLKENVDRLFEEKDVVSTMELVNAMELWGSSFNRARNIRVKARQLQIPIRNIGYSRWIRKSQ